MSPTLVTLHAHPDDEAIFTGGTIARAIDAGWRAVVVVATDGGRGTTSTVGDLDLVARRQAETLTAARALGVHRVEFLGYGDSGFDDALPGRRQTTGRPVVPGTLAAAYLDGPVTKVRGILDDESAAVLTSYDDNGIYGHVDHVRVHEIGRRAVIGTSCELVESTLDRTALRRLRAGLRGRGLADGAWPSALTNRLGVELDSDVVAVDVRPQRDRKMAAISAHASQVMEASSFMGLPAGAFHHLLDTEWFRVARPGRGLFTALVRETDPVAVGRGSEPSAGVAAGWEFATQPLSA